MKNLLIKMCLIILVFMLVCVTTAFKINQPEKKYIPKYIPYFEHFEPGQKEITKKAIEFCNNIIKGFSEEECNNEAERLLNDAEKVEKEMPLDNNLLLMKLEVCVLQICSIKKFNDDIKSNETLLLLYKELGSYWQNLRLFTRLFTPELKAKISIMFIDEALWCKKTAFEILLSLPKEQKAEFETKSKIGI